MELITIENLSNIEQHVWDELGIRHSLPPHAILPRREELAKLFLKEKGKYVRKYVPFQIPDVPGEPKQWLANVSGNPLLPKEITFPQTDRKTGLTVYLKKPNPLATPVTVKHKMQRGQERALDGEGKETALNLPPVTIKFPPGTRLQVSDSIANWLIMRDDMQEDDCRGRLIRCREPSEFEPNESWDYDDIRLYAEMMDAPVDLKKAFPPAKSVKGDTDVLKERLVNTLFFFLVDEKYSLPPKHAFDAKKAGKVPESEE